MFAKHGSSVIILGAVLAIIGGTVAFYFTSSLGATLGTAAGVLFICALAGNLPSARRSAPSETAHQQLE